MNVAKLVRNTIVDAVKVLTYPEKLYIPFTDNMDAEKLKNWKEQMEKFEQSYPDKADKELGQPKSIQTFTM